MAKMETKTPYIQAIFEKDQNRTYTENALLYQDILNYSIKTRSKKFKLRSLGMWLLDNHFDWKKYYDSTSSKRNTPYRARYENRKDRIASKVRHLLQMNLMSSDTTRAEKVDMEIPLLELTGEGTFIVKMLERRYSNKKHDANEELYNLIQKAFSDYGGSSSSIIFLSKLYSTYKDRGLLDHIFDVQHEVLENSKSITFLFWGLFDFKVFYTAVKKKAADKSLVRQLAKTFFEAEDSLDWYIKENLRFIVKSGYERDIINQYPSREWENLWIKTMNDNSKLVTTATCRKCGPYPVVIDIPEQLYQFFKYLIFSFYGKNIKCSKCNKNMVTISKRPDRPFNNQESIAQLALANKRYVYANHVIQKFEQQENRDDRYF